MKPEFLCLEIFEGHDNYLDQNRYIFSSKETPLLSSNLLAQ